VIVKTDAIVLQATRFRESSKLASLYTREHGKMRVIARGAMQAKNRYGALLQPMAFLSTVIYRKEGRDLQNLSNAEPVERFATTARSLERLSAGMAIVELIDATMHDEDRNEELFETVVEALRALDAAGSDETNVLLWFITRLALSLGYGVQTDDCGICRAPVAPADGEVSYSLSLGAPLCSEHHDAAGYRPMSRPAFTLLGQLLETSALGAGALPAPSDARAELREALTSFVRFHVDGLRRLNAGTVAMKILGGEHSAPTN